jgi:hypothetical protein
VGEDRVLARLAPEQRRASRSRAGSSGRSRRAATGAGRRSRRTGRGTRRASRRRDDPVRVVVDERDVVQYFSKCPAARMPRPPPSRPPTPTGARRGTSRRGWARARP